MTLAPDDPIVRLLREALMLVLICAAPPVLASLAVGLIVSLFQATTQLQEQTLVFVPKVVAVFGALVVAGPWMGVQLTRFTEAAMNIIPSLGG